MTDMNIYTKRLHSFRPKRRPSAASSSSKPPPTKWPHDRPSGKTLAAAGFYFNPTEGHPDNVTCYLCSKDLDGWEPNDDPSAEHLKHCPDCGWARVVAVTSLAEDPRGARMVRARADTFGRWWPHEGKQGWAPSVQRMAEAGWHYAPTKDSVDFANCANCELSLDGWEPTDDPKEEHRRRSPECAFFTWTPPRQPTRKTSRASMQSVMAGSDDEPITKPTKKASRTKKPKKVGPEPENVFEDAPRGQKRTNTAAQQGPVVLYDGTISTEEETVDEQQQQPAQKKRATRASLAAQQLSRDAKMHVDSDNESMASAASRVGGKSKAKAKKPAARRASRARGNSAARKTKAQPTVPSDDELDRALALDLERPLTDEEEGFKGFKKPFIRPMKRLTRSRASLAVEEKMRNAPLDSILNSTAKRGRSRTPAADADIYRSPTKSPSKRFFRESSQDFSIPVRVPKHLAVEDDLPEVASPGRGNLEDGYAGDTIKVSAKEITDTEMEIQVKPKKAPAKRAARGRKKKDAAEAVTATEDEPEVPKPKRGKAAKKAASTRERESNVTVDSVQEKIELQLHQEQEERPQKGRRKLVRGTRPKRESVISIASTTEPEPTQSFMDVDHHHEEPAEASDGGSVIHHDVDALYPTLAPSPEPQEVEMEEAEPTPKAPKPTKKASKPAAKRSTRSSAISTASTTVSSIAGSHLNSGGESDTPRPKGRKPTKKQLARLGRAKNDALKKGSESFFSSAQSEELKGRKGRRTRSSMTAPDNNEEEEDSVRVASTSSSPALAEHDSSFVSAPSGDTHLPETAHRGRESAASTTTTTTTTDLDATEEASAPETEEEGRPRSPAALTPARMPLSPVRRGMNVPLTTATTTTPKAHAKSAATAAFHSRKPWVAVDLDTVFAHLGGGSGSEESDEGAGVLAAHERDMTVAEWIKWNAAQAEGRMKGEAERIVALFEACGRRARETIEAMETVD